MPVIKEEGINPVSARALQNSMIDEVTTTENETAFSVVEEYDREQ